MRPLELRIHRRLRSLRQKDGEYPAHPCIVSSQAFFNAYMAENEIPDPEILALMRRVPGEVVFEGRAWFIDDTVPEDTFQIEMYANPDDNPHIHVTGKFNRWTIEN